MFKISQNHERVFSRTSSNKNINTEDEFIEENVYYVDEETGEIEEGSQLVENPNYGSKQPPLIKQSSKQPILGLSMKKKTKASFM